MASFREKNGSYEARWRYHDRLSGIKKQGSKNGFKTPKQAKDYAKKMEVLDAQNKLYINRYTVESYLNEWIRHKSKRISKKTAENYKNAINNHIIPTLGKKRLSDLRKMEYQKFIYSELEKYSLKTVKLVHSVMSSALNNAVDNEVIERNITHNTDFSNTTMVEHSKIKFFNNTEIKVFLNSLDIPNNMYDIYFLVVANTGMRASEALALKWEDLNSLKKELNIDKSVQRVNGTSFEIGKPKTASSVRKIGVDDFTLRKLEEWKSYQNKFIFKKGLGKTDFIFNTTQNRKEPPHYRTVLKAFNQRIKELGLNSIGLHGLRHTHAVMLLEAGASIKYVAERLGHSNVEMTLNVYVHLTEEMKKEDMNKFMAHMGLN